MATTQVEKVSVVELTRYGFKNASGEYVNWGKKMKDTEKTPVVPGSSFDMELWISDSGKKYVNKVIGATAGATAPVVKKTFVPKAAPTLAPKAADSMSKDEWAAKDQRISRQGVIQAAVLAVAPHVATELVFEKASALADQMLEFVNRK